MNDAIETCLRNISQIFRKERITVTSRLEVVLRDFIQHWFATLPLDATDPNHLQPPQQNSAILHRVHDLLFHQDRPLRKPERQDISDFLVRSCRQAVAAYRTRVPAVSAPVRSPRAERPHSSLPFPGYPRIKTPDSPLANYPPVRPQSTTPPRPRPSPVQPLRPYAFDDQLYTPNWGIDVLQIVRPKPTPTPHTPDEKSGWDQFEQRQFDLFDHVEKDREEQEKQEQQEREQREQAERDRQQREEQEFRAQLLREQRERRS